MKKPVLYIVLFLSLVIGFKSYAAEALFFDTLYDVPIMPGMEEIPDMALSFDKPDGRIAQAGATVDLIKEEAIIAFYQESLKQMGWQKRGANAYVREGEKLEILIEKTGTSQLVRFYLKPL